MPYDPDRTPEALDLIKAYPSQEARQIILFQIMRLNYVKTQNQSFASVYDKVLFRYVEALGYVGAVQDSEHLKNIKTENSDLEAAIVQSNLGIKKANRDYNSLPLYDSTMGISKLIGDRQNLITASQSKIKIFEKQMRERVAGQDEVIDILSTLYTKDLVFGGQRERPEVLYMMGLPGNGKDTIAESFVDALYNYEGAYEEHMFRLNISTESEMWSHLGSSKGYLGSEELPDFLEFLAKHSGGKYKIGTESSHRGERKVIELNPDWTPSKNNSETSAHRAVIFVNEAHNIPKSVKDKLLKQGIERGLFPINNPGTGPNAVSTIQVPVTFIFASNEGINLLEPREANGERNGEPLSYEELIKNYEKVAFDKRKLKSTLQKTNGKKNSPQTGRDAPGVSEEFLSRIPEHRLVILKPLSLKELKKIAQNKISKDVKKFRSAQGDWGSLEISIDDAAIDFLINYKYVPSDNARPMENKVQEFILDPIFEAIKRGKIKTTKGDQQLIQVGIKQYKNNAVSVVFDVVSDEGTFRTTRLIKSTLSNIAPEPLSDERIAELLALEEKMNANVFGIKNISKRLVEAAVVSESESRSGKARPATVMAFLGKTSTGKTEAAKQYVKARYGEKTEPMIIDFNKIQTIQDMKAKITGSYDSNNDSIPSEFMKAYDRANGNIAFIFDEAANSPKELLKALYEVLREANANGFSDGVARPMTNVTIILTGNAGEKIYQSIPSHLSPEMREKAAHEVFKLFLNDENLQRNLMLETFPDALLARIGRNIYHFGPHIPYTKRQMTQLKLKHMFTNLLPNSSERGWKFNFASEKDIYALMDLIENEGFLDTEQGASIDKFVREELGNKFKTMLLANKVKSGSEVTISVSENVNLINDKDVTRRVREIVLTTEDQQSIKVEIAGKNKRHHTVTAKQDQMLTAYHEAGHEIVSEVFFGDRVRPSFLSIIPGISRIGDELVHYAGLRSGNRLVHTEMTREVLIRQVAIMLGGYVAEEMVTFGARNHDGKSNDIMRASNLITHGILKYGLSKNWGMRAAPDNGNLSEFIAKELSDSERAKLHEEVTVWLKEAEDMARHAILANYEKCFVPLSKLIARKGLLIGEDIESFYKSNPSITERDNSYNAVVDENQSIVEKLKQAFADKKAIFLKSISMDNFEAEKAYNLLTQDGSLLNWFKFSKKSNDWKTLNEQQKTAAKLALAHLLGDKSRDARFIENDLMIGDVADVEQMVKNEIETEKLKATKTDTFKISSKAQPNSQSCLEMFL